MPRSARRRGAIRRPRTAPRAAAPVASGADGLALARRRFLGGERLSPERLAGELGISRATAYRRFGNAEQLAGEVIARLAEDTFQRTVREARGRGADRVVDHLARGMRYIASNRAYRAFLERDPEKALWIVTSKAGPVQARVIALNEAIARGGDRAGEPAPAGGRAHDGLRAGPHRGGLPLRRHDHGREARFREGDADPLADAAGRLARIGGG